MIGNKERREVAARLRENAGLPSRLPNEYSIEVKSALVLSKLLDCIDCSDDVFLHLADLIDRPAIKPEPSGRAYWRCPRCGAFNYRLAVTDCCGVIPAHYCANCGAEVVG